MKMHISYLPQDSRELGGCDTNWCTCSRKCYYGLCNGPFHLLSWLASQCGGWQNHQSTGLPFAQGVVEGQEKGSLGTPREGLEPWRKTKVGLLEAKWLWEYRNWVCAPCYLRELLALLLTTSLTKEPPTSCKMCVEDLCRSRLFDLTDLNCLDFILSALVVPRLKPWFPESSI